MADPRTVKLTAGTWYAGYHTPFLVTESMVKSGLEKMGFTQVLEYDRDDPLPVDVQPRTDKLYRDDWEQWLSAVWSGPDKTLEVPHADNVDWLVAKPAAPKPTPTKPTQEQAAEVNDGSVLAVVVLYWVLSQLR